MAPYYIFIFISVILLQSANCYAFAPLHQNILVMPLYMQIVLAITGGFVLNFMPCVLPALSIKLINLTKHQTSPKASLCWTVAGIMTSFWCISAISIVMKRAGSGIGIGMGFQNTSFLILLVTIITIFISISLDKVSINISEQAHSFLTRTFFYAHLEAFFGGVIATILSIPCTAPFLGSAVAVAMFTDEVNNIVMFTSIGIGFSIPYILCMIKPEVLNFLPRPGKWLVRFKNFLAVLLIISLIWLLGVLAGQLTARSIFGLFLIVVLIKFTMEEPKIRGVYKIIGIIVLISSALYLPQMANKEDMAYRNYVRGIWVKFDESLLERSVSEGKVVLVDVTADWCITCQFNKLTLWDRSHTVQFLSHQNVVTLRADITHPNAIAEKLLTDHKMYGIPFNIIYGPNARSGIVLPTLLSYEDLVDAVYKARTNEQR